MVQLTSNLAEVNEAATAVRRELQKVVVGQDGIIEGMLTALLAGGHVLLSGPLGQGKTLLASVFAKALGLSFTRLQFTADVTPSDLVGMEFMEKDVTTSRHEKKFVKGWLFSSQMILADEINRASPRTQSALLEALESGQVSAAGQTFALNQPFFLVATRSGSEREGDGTYPLPISQLDRFMICLELPLPSESEEVEMVRRNLSAVEEPTAVLAGDRVLAIQKVVRSVDVSNELIRRAVSVVQATRPQSRNQLAVHEFILAGASSRACTDLVRAAQARAILQGRTSATNEDIDALVPDVLQHRVEMNFHAEAEGVTSRELLSQLLAEVQ